jgi:hypothetical protein
MMDLGQGSMADGGLRPVLENVFCAGAPRG